MSEAGEQAKALKNQMLEYLGLERDPFDIEPQSIYLGPMRQHYLESLRHLTIFGDMVLLLTGEPGAGKSTLLRAFVAEQNDALQVLSVTAGGQFSGQGVLSRLCALAGITTKPESVAQQKLQQLLAKLQQDFDRTQRRALIVIDDAEQLPNPELNALLQVFRGLPEEAPVVLLLAGMPALESHVSGVEGSGRDEWYHTLPLRPFDREEALSYIHFRLEAAGYDGQLTLTEQQAAILAEGGKGLPGRIHRVFPAVLMGAQVFSSGKQSGGGWPMASKVLAGVVVLLVGSFLFVAYQHGLFKGDRAEQVMAPTVDSEQVSQQQAQRLARIDAAIASQGDTAESADKEVASANEGQSQSDLASATVENEAVRKGAAGVLVETESLSPPLPVLPDSETLAVPSEEAADSERMADARAFEAEPEERDADVTEAVVSPPANAPRQTEKEVASAVVAEEVVPDPVSVGSLAEESGPFKSKGWVVAQSPTHYTIQVLGSFNRKTATDFVATAARKGLQFSYTETRYKSRPWYVVLYGQYATKDLAREALDDAPAWLKAQKPWLRSFEGVQSSLAP